MHLFYTPDITGDTYSLSEDESKHCTRVLRLKEGDVIYLTDGRGTLYTTEIVSASGKRCEVAVVEKQNSYGEKGYSLTMAVAPTKNIDRYEMFLEKATEIGIDRIIPLECANSERRIIKHERLEKVVTSAVKQSLKAYHPGLDHMTQFSDVVNADFAGIKLIAHCREDDGKMLLRDAVEKHENVLILIGPEGDFSKEEIFEAESKGFIPVSLGNTRLRVETAAIVACHAVALLNQ